MLKRSTLESEIATEAMGSLKTASRVLLVVRGGREVRGGGGGMLSDSEMLYVVPMSVRGDMTVETLGISRSLRSVVSEPAAGVRVGRMGRGMAEPERGKREGGGGEEGRKEGKKFSLRATKDVNSRLKTSPMVVLSLKSKYLYYS